jgi:hypothetical protein
MSRSNLKIALLFSLMLLACGGDDATSGSKYDAAEIEAAPLEAKTTCEAACAAADQIRSQSCGQTEFSTHEKCYIECVGRYLSYPSCSSDFDEANHCIADEICEAQTVCSGAIVMAAACMQITPPTE